MRLLDKVVLGFGLATVSALNVGVSVSAVDYFTMSCAEIERKAEAAYERGDSEQAASLDTRWIRRCSSYADRP